MKIKTVIGKTESEFDNKVNTYLHNGYILARRDIVLDGKGSLCFFYAELVAEVDRDIPEPADPVACAEEIRRHCESVSTENCKNGVCRMAPYCDAMINGKTPEEWPCMADDNT